ncbi:VOC family protein [Auraticoccus monumenti]|uniref:VOC domain-containing protein n=1 Tax=Auraticoccus monumenti TaxID=675864 RepID=A0A1G7C051_9ACTN|nr:hypothetical protein SAMN04489747_3109 [Auraticoccus monumenti]
MTTRFTRWPEGVPCWVELTTTEPDRALTFYSAVLGWTRTPLPGRSHEHVVVRRHGAAVAGLRRAAAGDRTGWAVYIAADDVDARTADAVALGAEVVVPPEDHPAHGGTRALGRRAVVSDPAGGWTGLWQGLALNGCQLVNEPGGLCFEELASPDPAAAGHFLRGLFGYVLTSEPTFVGGAGPRRLVDVRGRLDVGAGYTTFRLPDESIPLGASGTRRPAERRARTGRRGSGSRAPTRPVSGLLPTAEVSSCRPTPPAGSRSPVSRTRTGPASGS